MVWPVIEEQASSLKTTDIRPLHSSSPLRSWPLFTSFLQYLKRNLEYSILAPIKRSPWDLGCVALLLVLLPGVLGFDLPYFCCITSYVLYSFDSSNEGTKSGGFNKLVSVPNDRIAGVFFLLPSEWALRFGSRFWISKFHWTFVLLSEIFGPVVALRHKWYKLCTWYFSIYCNFRYLLSVPFFQLPSTTPV